MNWSKYPLLQIGTGLYIYSEWYTVDEVTIGDIILSCKFGQVYWLYSKMLECEIVVAIPSSSHTITHTHTHCHTTDRRRQVQRGRKRQVATIIIADCHSSNHRGLRGWVSEGGWSVTCQVLYILCTVYSTIQYNVYVLYVHCTLNRCTHV